MKAIAINREQGVVLLDDGSLVQMQNYVDRFGEDTEDASEAVSAIASLPDGTWLILDLDEFEPVVRH